MNKIYTKTGDKGTTSLLGGKRVSKNNIVIETYGTLDELNSFIGLLITKNNNVDLIDIQNNIFLISSYLADIEKKYIKIEQLKNIKTKALEKNIDSMTIELPVLKNFILPGGCEESALAHVCRTITRRAERKIVKLNKLSNIDENIIAYINRLSDYFFTLARYYNYKAKISEEIWKQ